MRATKQVKPIVHLLGDAILDNYYNLTDSRKDLAYELTEMGFRVNNYAVDDVKVADVINGLTPREIYTKSRSYHYPVQSNGKMYPLKSMLNAIGVNKSFSSVYSGIQSQIATGTITQDNMVVISMGGNDIHDKMRSVLLGAEYFINSVTTKTFVNNFKKIIETALSACDKIVLVSVYLPYLGTGSKYAIYSPFANAVINKWNKFIRSIAQQYNIPLLDLSRTLNVGTREHYGKDETRVSNISNKCMAKCLAHIHANYSGYRVYYAENCDPARIKVE